MPFGLFRLKIKRWLNRNDGDVSVKTITRLLWKRPLSGYKDSFFMKRPDKRI